AARSSPVRAAQPRRSGTSQARLQIRGASMRARMVGGVTIVYAVALVSAIVTGSHNTVRAATSTPPVAYPVTAQGVVAPAHSQGTAAHSATQASMSKGSRSLTAAVAP